MTKPIAAGVPTPINTLQANATHSYVAGGWWSPRSNESIVFEDLFLQKSMQKFLSAHQLSRSGLPFALFGGIWHDFRKFFSLAFSEGCSSSLVGVEFRKQALTIEVVAGCHTFVKR